MAPYCLQDKDQSTYSGIHSPSHTVLSLAHRAPGKASTPHRHPPHMWPALPRSLLYPPPGTHSPFQLEFHLLQ